MELAGKALEAAEAVARPTLVSTFEKTVSVDSENVST
jgi:hypothetical protein